jgi:hypothetical protein
MDAEAIESVKAEVLADAPHEPEATEAIQEEQSAVAVIDPAESLAGALQVASIAAGYAGFPKAAAIWTPGTCRALADKAVPVLVKYPWGQRIIDFLQTGAGVEELALLATAAPLVMATIAAVREDMKPAAKPAATEAATATQ